uniref:Uncharacterized protein n=1 Tax=Babesia bovis TaxID=5865 RepID=S6B799_BABBO|nr:hypothetical protein [Babesia bovis]
MAKFNSCTLTTEEWLSSAPKSGTVRRRRSLYNLFCIALKGIISNNSVFGGISVSTSFLERRNINGRNISCRRATIRKFLDSRSS